MYVNSSYSLKCIALLVLSSYISISSAIVVDGQKRDDLSATKHQSDPESMIDAFNTKSCGIADPNHDEHEFVSMARAGQFPWIVSFQIKVVNNSTSHLGAKEDLHFCSGSFISDKWILSAAHCFIDKSIKRYFKEGKLMVVAGSQKVLSRVPINRNLTISKIFYHSKFDKSVPVGFDIALVELKDRLVFTQKLVKSKLGEQSEPFMNTICLPLKDKKYKFNETARIAGWGLSGQKEGSGSMPSKLLTTDIPIDHKDSCIQQYVKAFKSDKPKTQREKYDDFICAGYKKSRDACQSDSGGPLMQFADNKAVAIGIVSYGIGCGTKGIPGLYTRTSSYINWIRDIMKDGNSSKVPFNLLEAKHESENDTSSTTTRPSLTSTTHPSSTSTTKQSTISTEKEAKKSKK